MRTRASLSCTNRLAENTLAQLRLERITGGRFEAVAAFRARVEEDFGPDAARGLAPLARFEGVAWDPPDTPLSVWVDVDHPALAFWGCLRLAESPDCPDDLRQEARRRMKQLDPGLHALFMRHATNG
jgi:hypothetical protein